MNEPPGWAGLVALLSADPHDVGCAEVFEHLDLWVDLLLAGDGPAALMPGMAAHLAACTPCADDVAGLLAVAG